MAIDTIMYLPHEVIVYILEDSCVDFQDVLRFGFTCKDLFKVVTSSNQLWKTKFFQKWPLLKEIYQERGKLDGEKIDWKEEVCASICTRRRLLHELSLMSSKTDKMYRKYRRYELSNSEMRELDPLFRPEHGAHPLAYYFLVDELVSMLRRPAITSNLTHRYYAFKLVRYLKENHLRNVWQKYSNLPPKQQLLELGATLVAQWCQPQRHVTYSHISALLDNIAEQTKELLREQYPSHSMFSTPPEQFTYWRHNNIDDNHWSIPESRQAVDCISKVLFQKLGFHGNSELLYYSLENSFIDRVLEYKRGIPVTLAIVFESVARRLGIHCELVKFPSHFLLRWKEKYSIPASEYMENFYIDLLNGGQFLTKRSCPIVREIPKCPIDRYNTHTAATAVKVVIEMANNVEVAARQRMHLNGRAARLRAALELQHMIQPHDPEIVLHLGQFYSAHRMDLSELIESLENMHKVSELTPRGLLINIISTLQPHQMTLYLQNDIEPKRRDPSVSYAIGLIVKHKTKGYLGVISGWNVHADEKQWTGEINVQGSDGLPDEPLYTVFADDGSSCYVTQENLVMAQTPEWINNYEIGRFFYKFNGTHYLPNAEKVREYPEDEEVRNKLLLCMYDKSHQVLQSH